MQKQDKKAIKRKKELVDDGYIIESPQYANIADTRIKPIINWLREGRTDYEITILILELFKIKENSAQTYLRAAKSCFKQEMILERKFNIIQHVKRYDKDILKLSLYQPKTNSYAQSIALKTSAYLDMINLMQKKEKVLGFHQRSTSLKIKNNINIKIKPLQKTFTFDNLSMQEKIDLFHLIEKTKLTDIDRFIIKSNPNKLLTENTIDIDHEEVVETLTNIDQIEHVPEPEIDYQIKHDHVGQDKNVIDTVGSINPGKGLDDIKSSILKNLLK